MIRPSITKATISAIVATIAIFPNDTLRLSGLFLFWAPRGLRIKAWRCLRSASTRTTVPAAFDLPRIATNKLQRRACYGHFVEMRCAVVPVHAQPLQFAAQACQAEIKAVVSPI